MTTNVNDVFFSLNSIYSSQPLLQYYLQVNKNFNGILNIVIKFVLFNAPRFHWYTLCTYTRFIFMTSELAIRVSLILIRLILLLQISDIVDFIFKKHELVVLACLQF